MRPQDVPVFAQFLGTPQASAYNVRPDAEPD